MKFAGAAIFFFSFSTTTMHAQKPAPPQAHHEANFDSERKQADALYTKGFKLQTLALYADLCRQDPTDGVLAERHGDALTGAASLEEDDAKRKALSEQAVAEFRRAKALGNFSEGVEHMLGIEEERQLNLARSRSAAGASAGLNKAEVDAKPAKNPYVSEIPKATALMKEAEIAFAKNDTATAFAKYKAASEADPGFYLAKLYTGDACFRGGDYPCAMEWFAKAVAMDPNIETAYRYWGDALGKTGKRQESKRKFEEAIVANPFTRLSWSGLQRWAMETKTQMGSPRIDRPSIEGNKVTLAQGSAEDVAVWTVYGSCRVAAASKRAAGSRRTADEETHCLEAAADSAAKAASPGPSVRTLVALRKDGMLESWLLLNGADQDVVQDYPAYRDAHRDTLIAYLDTYVVRDGVAQTQRPQLQLADPK